MAPIVKIKPEHCIFCNCCFIGLSKDAREQAKGRTEQLVAENKRLEKQKSELMTAFKKQMKLIDILKRQKVLYIISVISNHQKHVYLRISVWSGLIWPGLALPCLILPAWRLSVGPVGPNGRFPLFAKCPQGMLVVV